MGRADGLALTADESGAQSLLCLIQHPLLVTWETRQTVSLGSPNFCNSAKEELILNVVADCGLCKSCDNQGSKESTYGIE